MKVDLWSVLLDEMRAEKMADYLAYLTVDMMAEMMAAKMAESTVVMLV